MLLRCFAALLLTTASPMVVHAAADLDMRLQQAAKLSRLDAEGVKPWHMVLQIQLLDAKGATSGTETLEEWWAGKAQDKRVYTGVYTGSEVHNTDGVFRSTEASGVPYVIERMRQEAVDPFQDADLEHGTPDLRKEKFGSAPMDCIMQTQPLKNVGYAPLGLFPTYCLDRDKDLLRASFDFGVELAVRNRVGTFQGLSVGVDLTLSEESTTVAKAHVTQLGTFTPDDATFAAALDLQKDGAEISRIASGMTAGMKVSGKAPTYPAEARSNHISGTVLLHAIIGRDGHIHSLRVVGAPDSSLAIAAIYAVRTWTYKPYLLNGLPVEADTTINVNFKLSE